jgi:hypothetical protein
MNTASNVKSSAQVKTELSQILLSTITKLPTSKVPTESAWKLATPLINCGIKEFQGWSQGVGICDNSNLEEKLFLLTYFSAHQDKFTGEKWGSVALQGDRVAPIGVGRNLFQFMHKGQNYGMASQIKWLDRFEAFVKKYNLGAYHRMPPFANPNWSQGLISMAVWVWNGEHPPVSEFPKYVEAK